MREVEEVGVVAELSEESDGFERLRIFPTQNRFPCVRVDEEVVQVELEGSESTEDDVLVLDGDCSSRQRASAKG